MKWSLRFPIRLKIMLSLLFCITAVVSVIIFMMASFFHKDKQAYMNDWVSIAARSTAEECHGILAGYAERLRIAPLILGDAPAAGQDRQRLLQNLFDSLPALIEVELYRDGERIDAATDAAALDAAGLSAEDLRAYRAEHPLPLERILGGETYVMNTTISEELPAFTLAFRQRAEPDAAPVVVAAVLRLAELSRLGARFKVFEIVVAAEDGTLLAHPDARRVAGHEAAGLRPEAATVHEDNRAGLTLEFQREGHEVIGGYASADFAGVTVAAHLPKTAAYLASRELLSQLFWVTLILLLLIAVAGRFFAKRITRPIERLSDATRAIAKGGFDIQVDVGSADEIGALAGSFNQMASELKTRDEELEGAHQQLIQSEKLAAFGQLGAGIAHEVKNPLAGILGCAQLSLMEIDKGTPLYRNVELIERETARCKTIIDNLLKFARQEKALLEPTEVNAVVSDAVAIVNHQLELQQVKVQRELDEELPLIRGNGNQLQQVLMNLMLNAQQAMEGQPGTVTLSTRWIQPDKIQIVVGDTGPGIPEEIQAKLFEPFFTTKPTGKGTGLGLSVSFGIIKDHHGEIEIDSRPGEGARFIITLPVLEATAATAPARSA